jgi:integrase
MRRGTARRERAIILTLPDTCLRASEPCALTIGSVDLMPGRTDVSPGGTASADLGLVGSFSLGYGAEIRPFSTVSRQEPRLKKRWDGGI